MNFLSVTGKNWNIREINERQVYQYINEYGISDFIARVLISRNIPFESIPHFLEPRIKDLMPDPFHFLDMEKACLRVASAILNNEKIIVLGDYDVDGATSSALLIRVLKSLGCDAKAYIPDRIVEGYGPTIPVIEKFGSLGINLIITVDCGVTAFEPVAKANELGIDTIILDHHMSDITLPSAYAIVNPNRFDETTKYKDLAAVGVAFLFSVGLIKILREKKFFEGKVEPNLLNLLDLVALGTVCDMMNLTGLNRAFVIQGLKIMQQQKNLGLKTLLNLGKIDILPNSYHLGFVIGPRINAGGRVGKSYLGSLILSTDIEEEAQKYAMELENYNEERKLIEQQVLEEALEMAASQINNNFILVYSEGWHQGVVGIVAGKLKEKFQKPVAAVAVEKGIGKASCRSVKGIDFGRKIVEAKNAGILLSGGGHSMAAGFTIDMQKMEELKLFLTESLSKHEDALKENKICYYDAEIAPAGINSDLADEIKKLEPYGNGNIEPVVKISGLYVLKASVTNNKHINCLLAPTKEAYGNKAIRAISFNSVGTPISEALLSKHPLKLTIFGNVKLNSWQGKTNVQIYINDIHYEPN